LRRGLLYQLGQREAGLLERLVEEVSLAEELGLESVWCLPESGEAGDFRLGAPEFWLAALAGRTQRIRLGWGLAGMTPPERPPIRTAEQAASLDLACGGRLDLALVPSVSVGVAGSEAEEPVSPSDFDPGDPPHWDEGVRMLVEMWDQPSFSWTSDRFEVLPIDVLPKPAQRPHPPVWLVGWSVTHAGRAGRAGLGFLDVSGGVDDALEMHRDEYARTRSEADPNDLVCASAYAAVLGAESVARTAERLMHWESLGFDQAVLRVDPLDEESKTTRGRIRVLAGETGRVH
jgi:alkanesulfonate monooxygenase SsuD/methylene tetrahydromethanopterin reductase-like flavin-dependent oxidoreductase (luciferase family)